MLRVEKEYLNAQLVELPNGDYANTIMKAYFFAVYQNLLYENLSNSADEELRAIAQKSLKEVKYHYTHTETWMRIFAQGTEESRKRIEAALENLWEYTGGLFDEVEEEENLVRTLCSVVFRGVFLGNDLASFCFFYSAEYLGRKYKFRNRDFGIFLF